MTRGGKAGGGKAGDGKAGGGGVPALVFGALLLAVWWLVASAGLTPAVLLPGPGRVAASLWRGAGMLAANGAATSTTALLGFGLAIGVGLALAALMVVSDGAARLVYPNLLLFQLLPKIALGPLFVVWLGTGLPSRLAFTAVVSLFPVAIGTLAGLRGANPNQVRLCRALGASRWQVFVRVRVPTALPHFFAGAKVAATLAFTGAVVAEFISSDAGLGHVVMNAASQSDTALVFAALAVLSALGAGLYAAVALAEARARGRWGRG